MQEENKEAKRADNIIWNASSDYSFNSEIKAYDESGKADLYLNYIIGAVHKYYNYPPSFDFRYYRPNQDSPFSAGIGRKTQHAKLGN
jgi:hypothetical protein